MKVWRSDSARSTRCAGWISRSREGTVCGLLGPNGAGKTTAVRLLTTLLRPDAGSARVAGHDLVREPGRRRGSRIGVTGQYASVDGDLTGRQNLQLFARLHRVRGPAGRTGELLDRFGLAEAADRPASTYSGGMRRRLDLAASLSAAPRCCSWTSRRPASTRPAATGSGTPCAT